MADYAWDSDEESGYDNEPVVQYRLEIQPYMYEPRKKRQRTDTQPMENDNNQMEPEIDEPGSTDVSWYVDRPRYSWLANLGQC